MVPQNSQIISPEKFNLLQLLKFLIELKHYFVFHKET